MQPSLRPQVTAEQAVKAAYAAELADAASRLPMVESICTIASARALKVPYNDCLIGT